MRKGTFFSNVLKMGSATLITQVLGFFLLPILSRLYLPSDFGVYSSFLSIVGILQSFTGAKYEFAIVLAQDKYEASGLFIISILSSMLLSVLIFGILITLGTTTFYPLLGAGTQPEVVFLIPVFVLILGINQAIRQLAIRSSKFGIISFNSVVSKTIVYSTKLGGGFFRLGSICLIYGDFVGYIFSFIYYLFFFLKSELKNSFFKLDNINKNIILLLKKYKKFPLYELPNDFINLGAKQVPTLLLMTFFDAKLVGLYSFAVLIPRLIITLTAQSIGNVFYKKISESNIKNISIYTEKVTRILIIFGAYLFLFLFFFSKRIYLEFFGNNWELAGKFAVIFVPFMFLIFITKPIAVIFRILNKQEVLLYFTLLFFFLNILAVVIGGGIVKDSMLSIILLSSAGVLSWSGMFLYLLYKVNIRVIKMIVFFAKYISFSFVTISLVIISTNLFNISFFIFILITIVSFLLYSVIIFIYEKQLLLEIF